MYIGNLASATWEASAIPHTCEVCESELLFLKIGNSPQDPRAGWWDLITSHESSTAIEYGYWFNLWYGQAVGLAESGCELMIWLLTLRWDDTTPDSRLRAYYMHNSEEQLALDWVNELSDHTDSRDFRRKLVLCAEAEYVTPV
jgi:hypothetical protein